MSHYMRRLKAHPGKGTAAFISAIAILAATEAPREIDAWQRVAIAAAGIVLAWGIVLWTTRTQPLD